MRNRFAILVVAALCGCYTAPGSETQPAADAGVTSEVQADADADSTDAAPQGDVTAEVQATCLQLGVECGLASNGSWCGGCAAGKLCSTAGKCVAVEVKPTVDAGATAQDTAPAPQPDVQQQPAPKVTSCAGRCGTYDAAASCQCDAECGKHNDCCSDYAAKCVAATPQPEKKCDAVVKCGIDVGSSLYLWCKEFTGDYNAAGGTCNSKPGTKQLFKCEGGGWSCKTAETWATFGQFLCSGSVVNVCKTGEMCTLSAGKLWCANYSGYLNDSKQCATTSALAEKSCNGTWQTTSPTTGPSGYLPVNSFNCKPKEQQPAPQPDPGTGTKSFYEACVQSLPGEPKPVAVHGEKGQFGSNFVDNKTWFGWVPTVPTVTGTARFCRTIETGEKVSVMIEYVGHWSPGYVGACGNVKVTEPIVFTVAGTTKKFGLDTPPCAGDAFPSSGACAWKQGPNGNCQDHRLLITVF